MFLTTGRWCLLLLGTKAHQTGGFKCLYVAHAFQENVKWVPGHVAVVPMLPQQLTSVVSSLTILRYSELLGETSTILMLQLEEHQPTLLTF